MCFKNESPVEGGADFSHWPVCIPEFQIASHRQFVEEVQVYDDVYAAIKAVLGTIKVGMDGEPTARVGLMIPAALSR